MKSYIGNDTRNLSKHFSCFADSLLLSLKNFISRKLNEGILDLEDRIVYHYSSVYPQMLENYLILRKVIIYKNVLLSEAVKTEEIQFEIDVLVKEMKKYVSICREYEGVWMQHVTGKIEFDFQIKR